MRNQRVMETNQARQSSRLVLVDLDGTLLILNSFRLWVAYWNVVLLMYPRFWARWVNPQLNRLIGRCDRKEMKTALMIQAASFADQIPDIMHRFFVQLLWCCRRRKLCVALQKQISQGAWVTIVTAAPAVYVNRLSDRLNLSVGVASECMNGVLRETLGIEKLRAVTETILSELPSGTRRVLITDHADDIPLARACCYTLLIKPSRSTIKQFSASKLPFFIARTRAKKCNGFS
ncbi:HAD family hydrolase [Marinobacter sp. C2H3]|uniref:HAD family hydrolase n=1 Tax=Marinobacter sp. C2H3 TaxID=3119003 RepID=UPI003FA54EFB